MACAIEANSNIARMLATHNIVEVPLPDAAVEAARDLDRALEDAAADYLRARQRLNMFLIAPGHGPTGGGYPSSGSRGLSAILHHEVK